MKVAEFRSMHPILGTRDIERALEFYVTRLGFSLAFRDGSTPTNYAGIRRGAVEVHLQWQGPEEMQRTRLRFGVSDPDALLTEFKGRDVQIRTDIRDTPWGMREFGLFDPDRNALTFFARLLRT